MNEVDGTGGTGAGREAFRWGRFASALASFAIVALLVAGLVGVTWGIRPLERRAASILATRTGAGDSPRVRIVWPPTASGPTDTNPMGTWLAGQFQEELLAAAYEAVGPTPDVLGRDVLDRVARAMARSGWFRGVPTVRREADGVIVVDGSWRVPAAVVRTDAGDRLVAWDGGPMPPTYRPDASGLWTILGVREAAPSAGPMEAGEVARWPGQDVEEALELLAMIAKRPWARQVRGIEFAAYSGARRMAILTRDGTRVVWGGSVARPGVGECSTKAKLWKIDALWRDFGRIDGGKELVEVFWEGVPLVVDLTPRASSGPSPVRP